MNEALQVKLTPCPPSWATQIGPSSYLIENAQSLDAAMVDLGYMPRRALFGDRPWAKHPVCWKVLVHPGTSGRPRPGKVGRRSTRTLSGPAPCRVRGCAAFASTPQVRFAGSSNAKFQFF